METERRSNSGLDKVSQYLIEDSLFENGLDQEKVEVEPEVVLVSSDSCTDEDS